MNPEILNSTLDEDALAFNTRVVPLKNNDEK